MKLRLLIFMCLLVSIVGACHKTAEPEPLPCAGLITLNGELNVIWTKPANELFAMRPAVFGNQVVIGKFTSPTTINLMGIGNISGLLLWSRLLPVNLGYAGYESAGNKIYYIDSLRTALVSFDVVNQQSDMVWHIPVGDNTRLSRDFAIHENFAVCSTRPVSGIDSLPPSIHLIDLSSGASRKVAPLLGSSILEIEDMQADVTPEGDTVICFVRQEYAPVSGVFNRLSCWNITTDEVHESDISTASYSSGVGNLQVAGKYAWFLSNKMLRCYNVVTGATVWTASDPDFYHLSDILPDGKIFVGGNAVHALDAATGQIFWTTNLTGYGYMLDLQSSFIQQGQLYLFKDNGSLVHFDSETGCLLGEHPFPTNYHDSFRYFQLSSDGNWLHLAGYKSYYTAQIPR
ncbi:MAG: PQQ-binding-like beta-propeller repeat protein [Saprospiraceae bacterium]